MWASYKGKTDVARCLIERGADVNCSGHHNAQPLIWACGRGYLEIAKMLLESKANPNRPDKVCKKVSRRIVSLFFFYFGLGDGSE